MSTEPTDEAPPPTELFQRLPEHAQAKLRPILQTIQPNPNGRPRAYEEGSWAVKVPWGDPLEPWEFAFLLDYLLGCPNFGRYEKLAWEFSLTIHGTPATVAFQKFGVWVYVDSTFCPDRKVAERLVRDGVGQLAKARPIVEKWALSKLADEQVNRGNLNVDNRLSYFLDMFEHFRDEVRRFEAEASSARPIVTEHGGKYQATSISYPAVELRRRASYEATAAATAFFSMLEHLLVIAVSLSDFDFSTERLTKFIGDSWQAKFKRMVDITDPANNSIFLSLKAASEQLRNPGVHGGFDKESTSLKFHLPGVGPVPVRLSAGKRDLDYSFSALVPEKQQDLEVLDRALEWLRIGPLRWAFLYGLSHLPISYDPESRASLRTATTSEDDFLELLRLWGEMSDRATNMDW